MTARNIDKRSDNIVIGAGEVYLDLHEGGASTGERYLGDAVGAALEITTEETTVFSGSGPVARELARIARSVTRTVTLTLHDLSLENLALFAVGEMRRLNAAAPVSGEPAVLRPGLWHQLGGADRPAGVLGLPSPADKAAAIAAVTVSTTAQTPVTATPGTEAAPAGAPFTARYEIVGSLAPPGVPTNFLIDVLGDGTRRLRWQPPADVDLAGVLIRYAAAGGTPLGWDRLTPLHRGHLTASPLETVEPPPGTWVFAARAIDTGGRLSTGDVRIVAELGPQRQGDALLWRCPSAAGWPGRLADIERSDDGHDALEGAGDYTWDDLTTWDAWQSWGAGNGTGAAAEFAFAAEPVDLGIAFDVALRWSAEIEGDGAFEYRAGASAAAVAVASWAAYAEGTTVAGRWLQLRWRVSGDGSRVLSLDHLCWSVHAPSAERKLLDRNTAEWQGTAATGRIVPTDLRFVTDLDITLQSVGAGWSWTLLSKNSPTRIRIYDGDGNPADAVVDAVVRGVAT